MTISWRKPAQKKTSGASARICVIGEDSGPRATGITDMAPGAPSPQLYLEVRTPYDSTQTEIRFEVIHKEGLIEANGQSKTGPSYVILDRTWNDASGHRAGHTKEPGRTGERKEDYEVAQERKRGKRRTSYPEAKKKCWMPARSGNSLPKAPRTS